jgi:hypothetical protein
VYDKKQQAGSCTQEMYRRSFRRKNPVDSARQPPQYSAQASLLPLTKRL